MIKISHLKLQRGITKFSGRNVRKPNQKWEIVNYDLNKEFLNRRNFVKVIPASVRTEEFLTTYP